MEYPIWDSETNILTVQAINEKGEIKIVTVQIIQDLDKTPFLGGFKIMPYDIEYHHAQTQTQLLTRTWSQKFNGNVCEM